MDDLISRKALREEIESKIFWAMVCPSAILEAIDEAPAVNPLPCKIGDKVWAIRNVNGVMKPQHGVVSEMLYTDDMRLSIVVRYIARGEWGKKIFGTLEEALEAINERKADGITM